VTRQKPGGFSTHIILLARSCLLLLPLWSHISPNSLSISHCLALSSFCVLFLSYCHTWPYRSQLPCFTRKTKLPQTDITSFLQHFTKTTATSACLSCRWRNPRHFPTLCVQSQRNILREIRKRKANWIGDILRQNCLLKQVIEGKIKGEIEVTRRRGRRRKKLLDDFKDRRGYSHLKEEALDRTVWRNRFGRGVGPLVRQITEWMNVWTNESRNRKMYRFYALLIFIFLTADCMAQCPAPNGRKQSYGLILITLFMKKICDISIFPKLLTSPNFLKF
jgi:hypothetical protein